MRLLLFCIRSLPLLVCSIILNPFIANAQQAGAIAGKVTSALQPVELASVSLTMLGDTLQQSTHNTTTDSLGHFDFASVAYGNYQLKVTYIGHQPVVQTIQLSAQNKAVFLANISLTKDPGMLGTVTINAQKKLIQKTAEGFIVNAAANIVQAGGTATDLLKSTPTIAVDADGGITLRGKMPLILINGRNSALTSIDQIAASSIESIEIINNASAKYDANAQSGIINIKLKKNKLGGTTGAVAMGVGAGSRIRTANSVQLNHKTDRWNIGLAYNNRFAGRTKRITAQRTNFFLPDSFLIQQQRADRRTEQLQNLQLNAAYTLNNNSELSLELLGGLEGQNNDETLQSSIIKQNSQFNGSNSRQSLEIPRSKLAEATLAFTHKFNHPAKILSASWTTSMEYARENTNINTQDLLASGAATGELFFQKTHNYEDSYVSDAIVDYSFPLSKAGSMEIGYKGTFRAVTNDYQASDKVGAGYLINPAASNVFDFSEQIHALYALYHGLVGNAAHPTWKYNIGLRAEQVHNSGNTKTNQVQFTNQYFKLFPTINVSYPISGSQQLSFSYAKRINRPDLGNLNPFVDITDALNPHSGNPALQPEIIQAFEVGYSNEWAGYSLSTNLFYRHATNTIRNVLLALGNGVVLRLPVNIGTADNLGIENIFTAKPFSWYDANLSITLFNQQLNGANIGADIVQQSFNWYGKWINNINWGATRKVQVIGNYTSAQTTPQGNLTPVYNIDVGYQQKLGKGNSRLGLIVVDVFNTLKSGSNVYATTFNSFRTQKADTRAIMLTFAHSFSSTFKEKLLENKFSKEF